MLNDCYQATEDILKQMMQTRQFKEYPYILKRSQNKKNQKMVSFLQQSAEKKTLFLVQLKQIFDPSYFDRALHNLFIHGLLDT